MFQRNLLHFVSGSSKISANLQDVGGVKSQKNGQFVVLTAVCSQFMDLWVKFISSRSPAYGSSHCTLSHVRIILDE